ncbi:sensory neuron membrane protein 1-like [Trichogramma pretiosum]|uniref:sensory neuron membrane protein 1-like n=1 Tax=Trichogramma pretiosum TaxID=7493 RepID=UPI0006C94D55|nr:sensory neuron membrane protein 1-like [Trichogramma pretiosum]
MRGPMHMFGKLMNGTRDEKRELAHKLGRYAIGMFLFGFIFGFILFPVILKIAFKKQVALKPGGKVRGIWSKFPFPLDFKIYLFNVTNHEEVEKGAKPRVQQVGPYFFYEWHEKVDLVDRKEDDTVEYAVKNKFIFVPEMSEGLTGDEILVMPHIFMLSAYMATVRDMPHTLPIVQKAINSVFKAPKSIFIKVRAMDMMFDGLPIDCRGVTDFAGNALCSKVREIAEGAMVIDEPDLYRFSLLGAKNNTASLKRMRVLRGSKRLNDVGKVVEYDGKSNISVWDDERCDQFNGTDGYVFHPKLYEDEDIVSFAPDICRSLSLTYRKKTKVKGLTTNRYSVELGDASTDPRLKCYCKGPDDCTKAGVMDLHKCVGVPLVISLPHMLLVHDDYRKTVDGLKPTEEEHAIFVDFQGLAGAPLYAKKRLQFNMFVHPVEKVKILKTFATALLPLAWVEEGVLLPKFMIREVRMGQYSVKTVNFIKYFLMLAGMILGGIAGFHYHQAGKNGTMVKKAKILDSPGSDNKNGNYDNGGDKKTNGVERKISTINAATLPVRVPTSLD